MASATLMAASSRSPPAPTRRWDSAKACPPPGAMLNAASALQWMEENGVGDPYGRVIALTASPDKALEFGVDETRILPFSESVGGRYSLWSSIGFPAAPAPGGRAFDEPLGG